VEHCSTPSRQRANILALVVVAAFCLPAVGGRRALLAHVAQSLLTVLLGFPRAAQGIFSNPGPSLFGFAGPAAATRSLCAPRRAVGPLLLNFLYFLHFVISETLPTQSAPESC